MPSMKDDQYLRKFRGMPEVSYGKCTRNGCREVSELADGLCVNCWDRTSYNCDLVEESEDCIKEVEESEPLRKVGRIRARRTGNTGYRSTFRY